jgi:glyoxylase-like metal-dependent hydrolase (beta-lactamase superfamily II)
MPIGDQAVLSTGQVDVEGFFDATTSTVSYIVTDPDTGSCTIIDPVLDYSARSGRTDTASADRLIEHVRNKDLNVRWILETHVHADHLTSAPYLQSELGGQTAIGGNVVEVQEVFAEAFHAGESFSKDGSQWDILVAEGQELELGSATIKVMETPGHTPACVSYLIADAVFVGDTIFMPDYGTARCDFPGGDANILYNSVQRILELPDQTRVFTCHDYGGEGRDYSWESSVASQRRDNVHLGGEKTRSDFVTLRQSRDAGLQLPELILPSVQVNMRAGVFPPAEENGVSYIKIPLNKF